MSVSSEEAISERIVDDYYSDDAVSPSEFIREQFFPLQDYDLIDIYELHVKISDCLVSLKQNWEEEQSADQPDPEVHERMKKRAHEFSIRFERNHLYSLQREVTKLSKLMRSGKAFDDGAKEKLRKTITSVHQYALNALQTYLTYVTSSHNIHATDKATSMINTIKNINESCADVLTPVMESVNTKNVELVDRYCNELLSAFKTPKKVVPTKPKKKRVSKDKNMKQSLLTMYEGKLGTWQKKSEMLAKLRLAKKSKKKKEVAVHTEMVNTQEKISGTARIVAKDQQRRDRSQVVSLDTDIDTEIRRFSLEGAKTLEDVRPANHLRTLLQEAIRDIDQGNETIALSKLKNLNVSKQAQTLSQNNVQMLCIKYEEEEEDDDTPAVPPEIAEKHSPEPLSPNNQKRFRNVFQPTSSAEKNSVTVMKISEADMKAYSEYREACLIQNTEAEGEIKPWDLLGKISDSLLTKMLSEVVNELDDDCFLQNLCENEIKNFK